MQIPTFADRVIAFNRSLEFTGQLPQGIQIMNPFREQAEARITSESFYTKYYSDNKKRHLILGINPGRFGAGVTGIPFTDTKRLVEKCQLPFAGETTHEPSAVFIYEMIDCFGGPTAFYNRFYINSVCPLGFTASARGGGVVNYNYYDSKALTTAVYDFMVESISKQLYPEIARDVCFCFGTGKNEKFLRRLNEEKKFFGKIVPLEHPRFIVQYKSKDKQYFIQKYLAAFDQVL